MTKVFNINDPEDYNDGYYHISKDVTDYPDAIVYIIWSKRGPGKTYSSLRYPYHKFRTLYMKRTNADVKNICDYAGDIDHDSSPWVPLNRDFNLNVKPRLLHEGFGAFYDADKDGNPTGPVVNYIASLNSIKKLKGMDLSDAEWIIFDEFIPQAGEVVKRAEGEMLLDLYDTVARDRVLRGRPDLKLMLFANAEEISTHITNALEVVDTMAEMQARQIDKYYDEERGIFFHHIGSNEFPSSTDGKLHGLAKVMKGTAWYDKSVEGFFSKNDFSNVLDMSLKHMRCMYHLHYRRKNDVYIYLNKHTGVYYFSPVKGQPMMSYDLDLENQQKKFFLEHGIDLRNYTIQDRVKYKKYSYYDLIMNYKKFYDV